MHRGGVGAHNGSRVGSTVAAGWLGSRATTVRIGFLLWFAGSLAGRLVGAVVHGLSGRRGRCFDVCLFNVDWLPNAVSGVTIDHVERQYNQDGPLLNLVHHVILDLNQTVGLQLVGVYKFIQLGSQHSLGIVFAIGENNLVCVCCQSTENAIKKTQHRPTLKNAYSISGISSDWFDVDDLNDGIV